MKRSSRRKGEKNESLNARTKRTTYTSYEAAKMTESVDVATVRLGVVSEIGEFGMLVSFSDQMFDRAVYCRDPSRNPGLGRSEKNAVLEKVLQRSSGRRKGKKMKEVSVDVVRSHTS